MLIMRRRLNCRQSHDLHRKSNGLQRIKKFFHEGCLTSFMTTDLGRLGIAIGLRSSLRPASWLYRLPLSLLIFCLHQTRLSNVSLPPLSRGMTWSKLPLLPTNSPEYWQIPPSRRRMVLAFAR